MKKDRKIKSGKTNFKTFLLSFSLFFSVFVIAQNTSSETFSDKNISGIVINGNQIFNINIKTSDTKNILVKSLTDGEYQNDFKVFSEIKQNQLYIELKRVTLEEKPNDKLSVHKVIAATLELQIPENFKVSVKSDIGSVKANGIFDEIKINLLQGGCNINGTAKIANIKTINENIDVFTKNAIISTDSKSGLVDFPKDILGFNLWKLTTVSGNITVKKLE